MASEKKKLSPVWEGTRGIFVSLVEVTGFGQIMVYFKNMMQTHSRPAMNLSVWYRGYGINAASIAPVTALQMAVNGVIKNAFAANGKSPDHLPAHQVGAAAFGAGAIAALAASPAELIILRQQKMGGSIVAATKAVVSQRGFYGLLRGYIPCALRDGIFSFGYLAGARLAKEAVEQRGGSYLQQILAQVAVGAVAGLISHPLDVVKTALQDPAGSASVNIFKAASNLYAKGGFKEFFLGSSFRTSRVVVSVVLYAELQSWLDRHYGEKFTKTFCR